MLVTALGQKSLGGASASDVLESILSLLARLLAPLLSGGQQAYSYNSGKNKYFSGSTKNIIFHVAFFGTFDIYVFFFKLQHPWICASLDGCYFS